MGKAQRINREEENGRVKQFVRVRFYVGGMLIQDGEDSGVLKIK